MASTRSRKRDRYKYFQTSFESIYACKHGSTYLHTFFEKVLRRSSLKNLLDGVYNSQHERLDDDSTVTKNDIGSYRLLRKDYLQPLAPSRSKLAREVLNNQVDFTRVSLSEVQRGSHTMPCDEGWLRDGNALNFCEDLQHVLDLFQQRMGEPEPHDRLRKHIREGWHIHQNCCIWILFGGKQRSMFIEQARKDPPTAVRLILRGLNRDHETDSLNFESHMKVMKDIFAKEYSEHTPVPPNPAPNHCRLGKYNQLGEHSFPEATKDGSMAVHSDDNSGILPPGARFHDAEVENECNVIKALFTGSILMTDDQYQELVELWKLEVTGKISSTV